MVTKQSCLVLFWAITWIVHIPKPYLSIPPCLLPSFRAPALANYLGLSFSAIGSSLLLTNPYSGLNPAPTPAPISYYPSGPALFHVLPAFCESSYAFTLEI